MTSTRYDYRRPTTIEFLETDIEFQVETNRSERTSIIATLKDMLAELPDANAEFKLSKYIIPATQGSSLELAQRAGQSKLHDLLNSEQFQSLEELSSLPDTALYVCTSGKTLNVIVNDTSMHIDEILNENEILKQYLDELSEYASKAGGFIYSSGELNVEQWLGFHGYPMPLTAQQLANLVDFLDDERTKLTGTGNYYDILRNPEIFPTALSLIQREQILKVIESYRAAGTGQLLKLLIENSSDSPPPDPFDAALYLNELLESMVGANLAQDCLVALGWHDINSDELPHPEDLKQLFMAAIVLNIDPNIGKVESNGRVLGFELYKPENAQRHPTDILLSLREHLVENGLVDTNSTFLAMHIVIADEAPEFLVKDIPGSMTVGSPAWVQHCVTVSKIETIAPGSSRTMTYEQVQQYADVGPFDAELEQLFGCVVIPPLLNWAATNRLIPYSADGKYTAEHFCTAETHYSQYTEALEQCSEALSTPLPTRHDMALSELKRAMPDGAYLTNKNYFHQDLPLGEYISIHELFMSGDLMNEGWTGLTLSNGIFSSTEPYEIDQINPYLRRLQDIQLLHHQAFAHYFEQLQRGTATALKLALCKLPEQDRIRIECGILSFYTVRLKFPDASTQETQRQRDKHRGRYGVIICTEYKTQRYYYELFTLQAICQRRPDLRDVFETTAIEYFEPTESADKDEKQWQTQALDWPVDINAYMKGTKPAVNVRNNVVIEKLWQSNEAERTAWTHRSEIQTFFSNTIHDAVVKLLEYFPPTKHEELFDISYGVAPIEAAKKNYEENLDLVLNLLIPFKSCIEDMTSGDPDREKSGVVGCALDALAVVGSVMGVASKFANAAMKAGSLLSRSIKLTKVSASFALSLVNPMDGVPSLLNKGGSITKKGVLLITRQGAQTSNKATRGIRAARGTLDAITAAKSLNCANLKFARLETLGDLSQATDVLLFNRANSWYELELNTCKPRGGKITNFEELRPA